MYKVEYIMKVDDLRISLDSVTDNQPHAISCRHLTATTAATSTQQFMVNTQQFMVNTV